MQRPSSLPHKIRRALALNINFYVRRQRPVIVYSPGRVGSNAIFDSLNTAGIFALKAHELTQRKYEARSAPGTERWTYAHVIRPRRPADIILLARDPVGLIVADFFPKLRWLTDIPQAHERLSVAELCDLFNTRYFEQGRHIRLLNWYDIELKEALGLRIYDVPFPKADGYLSIVHPPYRLLFLRSELDDADKGRIIGEFLGRSPIPILRSNVSENRAFGPIYKAFKEQLRIPAARLDEICDSAYARYFCSDEEIAALRARWLLVQ